VSFLDMFLEDPTDPVERAQAVAAIEEIRANKSPCDCDRADPRDPHEYWCPAVQETFCTGC
jgi:hypothetical protein